LPQARTLRHGQLRAIGQHARARDSRLTAVSRAGYLSIIRGIANLTLAEAAERLTGGAGPAAMNPFWATPTGAKLPDVHDFALGVAH